MNAVSSYFASTVAFLVVAIGWWAADAEICCNSSTVASGGGDVVASCRNKNRTFHTIETYGGGTCDDNQKAELVRKCCPLGQSYHKKWKMCLRAGVDGDKQMWRIMSGLRYAQKVPIAGMAGYSYEGLRCDYQNELVDVWSNDPKLLDDLFYEPHCYDLTTYGNMVRLECMVNSHCRENTCVRRCCKGDRMIVDGPNGPECTVNEKPLKMVVSKSFKYQQIGSRVYYDQYYDEKVESYYEEFKCSHRDMLDHGFLLIRGGSLYLTYENYIVPPTEYCVGYSQGIVTDTVVAYICDADTVFMDKRAARATSIHSFYWASYVASTVCVAFTLLMYNTLPSLRNNSNYYVKCYMSHEFASYICVIAQMIMKNKQGHTCVLFGYITFFVFLSTLCWLNVICFDIYWMISKKVGNWVSLCCTVGFKWVSVMDGVKFDFNDIIALFKKNDSDRKRYNISINRNTSTSVRTTIYHFYCCVLPSILVCTGFFLEYSQNKSLQRFAPNFELYGCFYYNMSDIGGVVFILLPVFVMLTVNLILFIVTYNHSSRIKAELNKFNRTDSTTDNFHLQREKFQMSIKLFLIMGVPYFFTVLTILIRIEGTIRYITYAASSLQGVFICIIFMAKPQVIMDLRKIFRGSMDHSELTQMNNISGSS